MIKTIHREFAVPQSPESVWEALTDSEMLAEWMYPNDFEPRVGHRCTFRVPGNSKVGFDNLSVRCEVLQLDPPRLLVMSWSVPGPTENSQVSFRLEPDGEGTRVFFEHAGFDTAQPRGEQAFRGAEFGWANLFKQLADVLSASSNNSPSDS